MLGGEAVVVEGEVEWVRLLKSTQKNLIVASQELKIPREKEQIMMTTMHENFPFPTKNEVSEVCEIWKLVMKRENILI